MSGLLEAAKARGFSSDFCILYWDAAVGTCSCSSLSSSTFQATRPWSLCVTLCLYLGVLHTILPLRVCLAAGMDGPVIGCCSSCAAGCTVLAGSIGAVLSFVSLKGSMVGSSRCWFVGESSGICGGAGSLVTLVAPLRRVRRFVSAPLEPLSAAPFLMTKLLRYFHSGSGVSMSLELSPTVSKNCRTLRGTEVIHARSGGLESGPPYEHDLAMV